MDDISAEEFYKLQQSGGLSAYALLDVREKLEYHTYNVGGKNLPLGNLPGAIADQDLDLNLEEPIIVICQRGLRSKTAKTILTQNGYKNVRNLLGGLLKLQSISIHKHK